MSSTTPIVPPQPKKRGRKPKNAPTPSTETNIIVAENNVVEPVLINQDDKPLPKKRGRKPKGGKIIVPPAQPIEVQNTKINVILHLKCSLKDLQTISMNSMEPYNSHIGDAYENIMAPANNDFAENYIVPTTQTFGDTTPIEKVSEIEVETESKELWKKLKQLEHQLHHNYSNEQNSACFWCTYSFDNPPIYIPKHLLKETYHVYGCFCSPECATAHLMQENLDSSTKFERYALLNNIYGGVYNYTRNIKPAPCPYYMLDKYYGNLSIQEYRSLLSNERLFLIVDKPLTKVMPELHQASEDHIINHKIIPANQGIKRPVRKLATKSDIVAENFGLSVPQPFSN